MESAIKNAVKFCTNAKLSLFIVVAPCRDTIRLSLINIRFLSLSPTFPQKAPRPCPLVSPFLVGVRRPRNDKILNRPAL